MLRVRNSVKGLDWSFIRGSSLNSLGIAAARVLGFAFSFVIARAFSSDEYGRVVYVIALGSLVAIASQPFGQHVFAYFIGKYRDSAEMRREILASAWTVWFGLILFTLLVSTPILVVTGRFSWGLMVVYIGITAFFAYNGIASGFLASKRLLAVYLGSNVVQIMLVALAVYVFKAQDGTAAIVIYGASYFLPLAVLIIFFPLPIHLSLGFNRAHVRQILQFAAPIWASHVLYVGYITVDVILLEHFRNEAAVGVYGLTKTLSTAFHFIPAGITLILMPKIAGMPQDGHRSILKSSLLATIGINLLGGIVYLALYRWFVVTFIGAEYFVGLDFAFMMALAAILFGVHGVTTAVFVGSGKVRYAAISRGIMLAALLSASLILIPLYGINGAAGSSLISVFLAGTYYIMIFVRERLRERVPSRNSTPAVEPLPVLTHSPEG